MSHQGKSEKDSSIIIASLSPKSINVDAIKTPGTGILEHKKAKAITSAFK